MSGILLNGLSLIAFGLYGLVAVQDLRYRRIANWLCLGILMLGVVRWGVLADPVAAGEALLAAAVAFGVGAVLHARGYVGGGDVKLLAASVLLVGAAAALPLIVVMALAGGVLSLALLAFERFRRAASSARATPTVPYGVAIGAAAVWVLFLQLS